MSGYDEEDDEYDRWYWSQVSHGGAGHHGEERVAPARGEESSVEPSAPATGDESAARPSISTET